MNNRRREKIQEVIESLEHNKELIEEIMNEEQEYLDNIPENFQVSPKAEEAEEAVNKLECVMDNVDEAIENLVEAAE
jgi:hypothetical protein